MKLSGLISCGFLSMFIIAWMFVSLLGAMPLGALAVMFGVVGDCLQTSVFVVVALPIRLLFAIVEVPKLLKTLEYPECPSIVKAKVLILLSWLTVFNLLFKRVMSSLCVLIKATLAVLLLSLCYSVLDPLCYVYVRCGNAAGRKFGSFVGELGVLVFFLPTTLAQTVKYDPTKKIPTLTGTNYAEWSWRIATVMISLGVGANLLTMWQPQQDVAPEHVHADGHYILTEGIKKAQRQKKVAKTVKDLFQFSPDASQRKSEE
jgi:hypothetical protein